VIVGLLPALGGGLGELASTGQASVPMAARRAVIFSQVGRGIGVDTAEDGRATMSR